MATTHHRETMSALLATHTAIRIARDVGHPPLEVPPQPQPAIPAEPSPEYDAAPPTTSWPRVLLDALICLTIIVGIAFLCWMIYVCLEYPPPLQ